MSKKQSSDTSTPKKRGPGQPTKYREEYCELLIKHMSEGLSYECFAGVVEVCRDTLYDWEKANPKFKIAKGKAFSKCQIFWEKAGLEGMYMGGKDNPFTSAVWIFNMKNRFNWTDKLRQEIDGKVTLENIVNNSFEGPEGEDQ